MSDEHGRTKTPYGQAEQCPAWAAQACFLLSGEGLCMPVGMSGRIGPSAKPAFAVLDRSIAARIE